MNNNYLDDAFTIIWRTKCTDNNEYCVVQTGQFFMFFRSNDIEEISYTNHAVKKNFTRLTGQFMNQNQHYIHVKDNYLHCTTEAAILCPGGIDSFMVGEDIRDYFLNGKIFTQVEWYKRIMNTKHLPHAAANVLGSGHE